MSGTFWMVWNVHRSAPKIKHPTKAAALAEATRLLRQEPGGEFYILQAVTKVEMPKVQYTDLTEDAEDECDCPNCRAASAWRSA